MAEEVKVDPSLGPATLGTAQEIAVKVLCGLEIVHPDGEMKRRELAVQARRRAGVGCRLRGFHDGLDGRTYRKTLISACTRFFDFNPENS